MQIFFRTREAARQAKFGKFKDNGQQAPNGKRFARELQTKTKQVKSNANK